MFTKARYARLKWACRRGMLELDVLLEPFAIHGFSALTEAQKVTFARLLTCDDPDLFAWFIGHQQCHDAELAEIVKMILDRIKIQD